MIKRLLCFSFAFTVIINLSAQQCQSSSFTFNLAIPDDNPTGATANMQVTLPVGTLGVHYVLDSVHVQINHTYIGDVMAILLNPAGDTVLLFDRPGTTPASGGFGCGNDNVDATFSSYSNVLAENICYTFPALAGHLKPVDNMSLIQQGNITGTWKLLAFDFAGADIGSIQGVKLYFTPLWYQDQDGDDYGAGVPVRACTQPVNYVPNNGDCNNSNPNIYPGAHEICGNKIDEDCSGEDLDYLYQPMLAVVQSDGFCAGDSALILISPFVSGDTVIWFHDQVQVPSNTGNYFYASEAGAYTATVIQVNGCYYLPNTLQIIEYPLPQPNITLTSEGLTTDNYETYTWYLDGQEIAGANDANWMPQSNGSYQVEVTDGNGCSGMSNTFDITNASVDENEFSVFNIYPNPANDFVWVTSNSSEKQSIEILDMQGKSLYKTTMISFPVRIETLQMADGIYLIRMGNQLQKLLIKR